jgi:hypothetical protein
MIVVDRWSHSTRINHDHENWLWREFREGRRLRFVILEPNPRISVVWLQDLLESVCGAAAAMARSPNPRQSLKIGFRVVRNRSQAGPERHFGQVRDGCGAAMGQVSLCDVGARRWRHGTPTQSEAADPTSGDPSMDPLGDS